MGMHNKKRMRNDDGDEEHASAKAGATIGQQTSGIKNKQRRSELYAKLKHKQKASRHDLHGHTFCFLHPP